ncbi:N-acetyl-1-D-myo-inositol-2-amino-2-deoxy-alpha-D-glucopyranoside deacetylase [Candidatus Protofrankia californiensis]|uniref:N-acetyl-1-D-myo-inositol-2-amino-2-deoxy-alpha- D-glucopyranoside deacetylase n=1 Tax=Candidatus Protofrankia californiensis TaxID=1839754 RepID=UPI0010416DAE|nr:N-acetyl-1-D-myo-inositol-2-amino-2-deoxy-alpha-D-glucopyranoside deacetylase [Candidatus Protofrankia californiensis]
MFVHAHPDDEVIGTGVSIASYAAAPDTGVTLVTCTLGEMGEVLVPELINLRSDLGDQLGGYRMGELTAACVALGVTDHRFLGGAGRWRDSGMMGTPGNNDPRCLWRADIDTATAALVRIVREVRPQVLVTYDENGGYGHPDHIRAHELTARAFDVAADAAFAPDAGPPWQPLKLYETAMPRSAIQAGIDYFRSSGAGQELFAGVESAEDVPMAVPDEAVTTEIQAHPYYEAKIAAMRAHATQMTTDGFFFALADGIGHHAWGTEYYVLTRGERGPGAGPYGRETDLFAGLDLNVRG